MLRPFAVLALTVSAFTACTNAPLPNADTDASWGEAPTNKAITRARVQIRDNITRNVRPIAGLRFVLGATPATPAQCAATTSRTNTSGLLDTRNATHVSFCLGRSHVLHYPLTAEIVVERTAAHYKNVFRYLLSWNEGPATTIVLSANEKDLSLNFTDAVDIFEQNLARMLLRYRKRVAPIARPSFGLNLASNSTQSSLAGESILFADVFRAARPFSDLSTSTTPIPYDENGWPTAIPTGAVVITSFLHGQSRGVPTGRYTVLYDGIGTIQYGGNATLVTRSPGRDLIDLRTSSGENNHAYLRISQTTAGNHVRNVRVVMPGGTCATDPRIWVADGAACASVNEFNSFETRLRADRNAMVFNPYLLWFLRDFNVVRFAKTMEASPQIPANCKNADGSIKSECLADSLDWNERASMNRMSFGSPGAMRYEDTRPVPVEAIIAICNQAGVSPWLSLTPNMSDDYLRNLAVYLQQNLRGNARVHLEYGSEMWNAFYLGHHYNRRAGLARGYGGGDPVRAGNEYYVRRSVESFRIFQAIFGASASSRLYRMLSGDHRSPELTSEYLSYLSPGDVDGFGVAPYFYGCYKPVWPAECTDRAVTPYTYFTATSVDQVFAMMRNARDPFGIDTLFTHVERQSRLVQAANLDFVMYEGGQSLRPFMVDVGDATMNQQLRGRITPLFNNANRDTRMGALYADFIARWRALGGKQMMFYTSPRTYSMFDEFGMTEHLTATRAESPKYRTVLETSEELGRCWWPGC